ncbi:MAG: hypothetical protein SFU25_00030, partial [Candidatus Caenarcaniphilales bacterium]|nr:hypothetical protein [Candidatus Caenarcaniphilales bacterium]
LNKLRSALIEVVASFPVYRTYITEDNISKKDKEYILWAVRLAKKKSFIEDSSIFDFIQNVLLLEHGKDSTEFYQRQVLNFTMRFQQFTGPVMAKGLEDTAFYRYNPLVSLNEVGADLRYFGCSLNSFHNQNIERVKRWPYSMLNSFTHDSKRSEDVRARINVISEIPNEWEALLGKLNKYNKSKKCEANNTLIPSANDEYLLYQTLIGSWPNEALNEIELEEFINRVENYMLKATREAKEHTSWLNPDEEYEQALLKFTRSVISSLNNQQEFEDFKNFQEKVSWCGAINSLSQSILKLTSPGVPDFYQGSEVWNYSLVDPDNRRKVNFSKNQSIFHQIEPLMSCNRKMDEYERHSIFLELMENYKDSRIKTYIISKTLKFRNLNQEALFNGDYIPLEAKGKYAQNLVSFIRKKDNQLCLVVVPLFVSQITGNNLQNQTNQNILGETLWEDTKIILPEDFTENYLLNFLSGEMIDCRNNREIEVYNIFKHLPFAILTNSF